MRVLGVDVGDRRHGMASSDDFKLLAQGLSLLECRNQQADLIAIQEVMQ